MNNRMENKKIYIIYEYNKKLNDIKYCQEVTNKKELCNKTGFYQMQGLKNYIYNSCENINKYFTKNNKKYVIIEEEA